MKKILFILFCVGCVQQSQMNEQSYQLLKSWIFADDVKVFASTAEIIDRPPGAEILLLQLKFQRKFHCVYYLVPYKSRPGNLTVIENKNIEACPELDSSPGIIEIANVQKLKISYQNFNLQLSFERDHKQEKLEFPFYNINRGLTHEKFKSAVAMSFSPGLEFAGAPKRFLGQLNARFSNGQALRCHQVNAKCETVGDFRCNECRYGWYEVADYNCPQGGSKFCGQNHCGEKNEPACPRGYKLFQNEDTGICQGDLIPVYNGEHILVCQ
jgi:hypothetical protein